MIRIWPSGVAGRVALILIGGILVIHAVGFVLFARDRWIETTRVFAQSVVNRMTAIVKLLEAAPAEDRPLPLASRIPDQGDEAEALRLLRHLQPGQLVVLL